MTLCTTINVYPMDFCREKRPEKPVYVIEDGRLYRTVDHELGRSEDADYVLQADGMIYRTRHHPLGASDIPDFRMHPKGGVYRTLHHPNGPSMLPVYEIRD
jgi:hypothetical protein